MNTLLSRIDSTLLYPPFLARVEALLEEAMKDFVAFWVISGFRGYPEQAALYAQGRTEKGHIVTNAKPGQSPHNFGIAVDLCRDGFMERSGLQPDWRPESYEPLRALAPKHGLVWGGGWAGLKDFPHVQMPDFVSVVDLYPLREAFAVGGLTGAWVELDRHFHH